MSCGERESTWAQQCGSSRRRSRASTLVSGRPGAVALVESLEKRRLLSAYLVTNLADNGEGSLREAIVEANNHLGPDTIDFSTGLAGTITLTSGQLRIQDELTINGPGADVLTVSGNQQSRVFQIYNDGPSPGIASISGLEIADGQAGRNLGGGLYVGGSLTLSRCSVRGNSAANGGAIAISIGASLTASDCTIFDNTASRNGGGIFGDTSARATLTNTTFVGNSAGRFGGAIAWGDPESPIQSPTLTNCTITSNSAPWGGGIEMAFPGLKLGNTILAGNTASSFGPDFFTPVAWDPVLGATPGVAVAASAGHNLIGVADSTSGWLPSDQTGSAASPLDPKLGALQDNGGTVPTVALWDGSLALNAGSSALAVDANGNPLATDERGLPRVYGPSVDIGAYESQPPALAGDVNHDGTVNLADLLLLARAFGKTTPLYEGGDLDGDGNVGMRDFLILVRNFGKSSTNVASALASSASNQPVTVISDDLQLRSSTRRPGLAARLVA